MRNASKPAPLTEAEWRIMQIVWQLKSCSAREVYTIAGEEHGLAPTTVKTFLSILVDKGYLTTKRTGNRFIYQPKRTFTQSLRHSADILMEKMRHEGQGPLLAYLVKKSKLSDTDISELRELLDEESQNR